MGEKTQSEEDKYFCNNCGSQVVRYAAEYKCFNCGETGLLDNLRRKESQLAEKTQDPENLRVPNDIEIRATKKVLGL